MGNFYTNITLRGPGQEEVCSALEGRNYQAYVAPTSHGFTVVYEERCDTQDVNELNGLAEYLTTRFECVALSVLNHDDDVLWLRLCDRGQPVVEYVSRGGPRSGAWRLCRGLGRWYAWPLVWPVMQLPFVLFEVLRHSALCKLLGLPIWSVGSGYTYIKEGEAPLGLTVEDLRSTTSGRQENPLG